MQNEPTNTERAARIIKATDEYLAELGEEISEDDTSENEFAFLVADMMHACKIKKLDFDRVLVMAQIHFDEEPGFERVSESSSAIASTEEPTAKELAQALGEVLHLINGDKDGGFFICEEGAETLNEAKELLYAFTQGRI